MVMMVMVVGDVWRRTVFRRGEDAAAQREPRDEGDDFLVVHNALPFRQFFDIQLGVAQTLV
jgi:hypothetical protein